MKTYAQYLARQLFQFGKSDSWGDVWHFRLVEIFLIAYTVKYTWTWGTYIQNNISDVMLPLGLAQYIDVSFMFDHHVALINAGLIAFMLLLGLTRTWRPAYAVALLLFHFQYVARYSLGEISHGSNLVGMGILLLGVAHFAFSGNAERRQFVWGTMYFFIGLGYTSAAVCKLVGTGIFWVDGHHLLMWIGERQVDVMSKFGAFEPNLLQELVLQNYHWGTLFLVFGLVAEASSFLMWFRKYRYYIVMLVISMHFGILLTMNIFFDASTYLLILLGLPWNQVLDAARAKVTGMTSSESARSMSRSSA